jgi:N4-gp56 family major capsid protein
MAITQSTDLTTLATATHHLLPYFDLRPQLFYDDLVSVDHTPSTHRGSSHNWNFYNDMPVQSTALTQNVDVTPVTMANTQRAVTISEYGAAIETTGFLRGVSYLEVNPIVAEIIGFNAGISVDTVARNRLEAAAAGTDGGVANTAYSDAGSLASGTEAARNRIAATDNISAFLLQYVNAKLRGTNVMPFGQNYRGIIHPDVSLDLRSQGLGTNSWADPHVYVDPSGIYNGVVGTFAGVMWMESPRASVFLDASNGAGAGGNVNVYRTYVFGREAFGKMYSDGDDYGVDPVFVQRQPTDYLLRFRSSGWKHMVGYSVFRPEAIWAIEAAATTANNTGAG